MNQLQAKFQQSMSEVASLSFEKENVIKGVYVCRIANGNMVILGKPGEDKTGFIDLVAGAMNEELFYSLVSRTSSPEEIWGPLDLSELEKGRYVRVEQDTAFTGKFIVIDELFKTNSALANGMLDLMANRRGKNGTARKTLPCECFIGISNEMPEGGAAGELGAFWNRCELKYVVDTLKDERNFRKLRTLSKHRQITTTFTAQELAQARLEAAQVDTSPLEEICVQLWKELKEYNISSRQWHNAWRYLQAHAWLDGRDKLCEDDVELLADMFWSEPNQRIALRKTILKYGNSLTNQANEVYDATEDAWQEMEALEGPEKAKKQAELQYKLKRAGQQLKQLIEDGKKNGKNVAVAEKRLESIKDRYTNLMADLTTI